MTGAVRYELWAWTSTDSWYQIGGDSLTGTTYTHGGVTAGITYYYTVRAVDIEGETSNWSDYASATALQEQQRSQDTATPTETSTPTGTSTPTDTSTATPTVASTDRGALVALYGATDGANWNRSGSWLSDEPLSSWQGVTLDENGRVGELRLSTNNLRGTIPDLSALTRLRVLDLGTNRLSGPIPDLSALASLSTLDLTSNQMSGPLPDMSALTNLLRLYLGNNRLTGSIPPSLGTISRLSTLYLGATS